MYYINKSNIEKTFHGVSFKPNETKAVPGYINDPDFERVNSMPVEPPKGIKANKETKKGEQ